MGWGWGRAGRGGGLSVGGDCVCREVTVEVVHLLLLPHTHHVVLLYLILRSLRNTAGQLL